MKILIGSEALGKHIPLKRDPKDVDYFSLEPTSDKETFYHPNLRNYQWSSDIASLNELYTIKISHIFWELPNNSWMKHAFDITVMQNNDASFIPELYEVLYPIWEERYGRKQVNLNTTADLFFNSHVHREYEHDSIHESIAYYQEPLFKRILKEGSEVAVSQQKFETLDLQDKYNLVREEIYATALERCIIPNHYRIGIKQPYSWALRKTITSFSKGWFPLFIALNFENLRNPDVDYQEKHLNNKHLLKKIGE